MIWRILSYFLYRRSMKFNQMMFRRASGRKFHAFNIVGLVNGWKFADWLFLYYLAKNMQGFVFQWVDVIIAKDIINQVLILHLEEFPSFRSTEIETGFKLFIIFQWAVCSARRRASKYWSYRGIWTRMLQSQSRRNITVEEWQEENIIRNRAWRKRTIH